MADFTEADDTNSALANSYAANGAYTGTGPGLSTYGGSGFSQSSTPPTPTPKPAQQSASAPPASGGNAPTQTGGNAMASPPLPQPRNVPPTMGPGSTDQNTAGAVSTLQGQLNTLGYYTGAIDGLYGPRTADAVKRLNQGYYPTASIGPLHIAGPQTHVAVNDLLSQQADARTTSYQSPLQALNHPAFRSSQPAGGGSALATASPPGVATPGLWNSMKPAEQAAAEKQYGGGAPLNPPPAAATPTEMMREANRQGAPAGTEHAAKLQVILSPYAKTPPSGPQASAEVPTLAELDQRQGVTRDLQYPNATAAAGFVVGDATPAPAAATPRSAQPPAPLLGGRAEPGGTPGANLPNAGYRRTPPAAAPVAGTPTTPPAARPVSALGFTEQGNPAPGQQSALDAVRAQGSRGGGMPPAQAPAAPSALGFTSEDSGNVPTELKGALPAAVAAARGEPITPQTAPQAPAVSAPAARGVQVDASGYTPDMQSSPHVMAFLHAMRIPGMEDAASYDTNVPRNKDGTPDYARYSVTRRGAIGGYQFEPGTWRQVQAGHPDIKDFQPATQERAAYYLATDTYRQATGREMEADLAAGRDQYVARVLSGTWTSLLGSTAKFADGRSQQGSEAQTGFFTAYQDNLRAPSATAGAQNTPTTIAETDVARAGGPPAPSFSGGQPTPASPATPRSALAALNAPMATPSALGAAADRLNTTGDFTSPIGSERSPNEDAIQARARAMRNPSPATGAQAASGLQGYTPPAPVGPVSQTDSINRAMDLVGLRGTQVAAADTSAPDETFPPVSRGEAGMGPADAFTATTGEKAGIPQPEPRSPANGSAPTRGLPSRFNAPGFVPVDQGNPNNRGAVGTASAAPPAEFQQAIHQQIASIQDPQQQANVAIKMSVISEAADQTLAQPDGPARVQAWNSHLDQMQQLGVLDPQTAQSLRNNPDEATLRQLIAMGAAVHQMIAT